MAIFQPIRNRLATIGIIVYQKYPLSFKNLLTFFMLSLGVILNCAFLLYEAKTFKEFADSVCSSTAMISATIVFGIFIWKTFPLYDSFDKMEKSVTKRELQ